MGFTRGGTFKIGGKTYNVAQINSVHIKRVPRHSAGQIWLVFFLAGLLGLSLAVTPVAWLVVTLAAFFATVFFLSEKTYAVVFDMSSGSVTALTDNDREKVESIEAEIVKGIEEGHFPNYLQDRLGAKRG